MKVTVIIDDPLYERIAYCSEIGSAFERCFESLATSDDPFMAWVAGDPCKEAAQKKLKLRDDAAKRISDEITTGLMDIMKRQDTHNGYRKTQTKGE